MKKKKIKSEFFMPRSVSIVTSRLLLKMSFLLTIRREVLLNLNDEFNEITSFGIHCIVD